MKAALWILASSKANFMKNFLSSIYCDYICWPQECFVSPRYSFSLQSDLGLLKNKMMGGYLPKEIWGGLGGCVCLGHTDTYSTKLKNGFVPNGGWEVLVKLEECVAPVGLKRLVAVFTLLSSIPQASRSQMGKRFFVCRRHVHNLSLSMELLSHLFIL